MARKEMLCTITGRVQMVMYRDFARRGARPLGISGWVRNEGDGSVTVLAQGEEQALNRFLERLRKGPLLSRVDDVHVIWREPREAQSEFRIRYD